MFLVFVHVCVPPLYCGAALQSLVLTNGEHASVTAPHKNCRGLSNSFSEGAYQSHRMFVSSSVNIRAVPNIGNSTPSSTECEVLSFVYSSGRKPGKQHCHFLGKQIRCASLCPTPRQDKPAEIHHVQHHDRTRIQKVETHQHDIKEDQGFGVTHNQGIQSGPLAGFNNRARDFPGSNSQTGVPVGRASLTSTEIRGTATMALGSQTDRLHSLKGTVWDAALLLGLESIGFASNFSLALSLATNIILQLLFCWTVSRRPKKSRHRNSFHLGWVVCLAQYPSSRSELQVLWWGLGACDLAFNTKYTTHKHNSHTVHSTSNHMTPNIRQRTRFTGYHPTPALPKTTRHFITPQCPAWPENTTLH